MKELTKPIADAIRKAQGAPIDSSIEDCIPMAEAALEVIEEYLKNNKDSDSLCARCGGIIVPYNWETILEEAKRDGFNKGIHLAANIVGPESCGKYSWLANRIRQRILK